MMWGEPVLVILLGNTALWPALFAVGNAFHPGLISDVQQHAILGLTTVLAAIWARSQVTPAGGK